MTGTGGMKKGKKKVVAWGLGKGQGTGECDQGTGAWGSSRGEDEKSRIIRQEPVAG